MNRGRKRTDAETDAIVLAVFAGRTTSIALRIDSIASHAEMGHTTVRESLWRLIRRGDVERIVKDGPLGTELVSFRAAKCTQATQAATDAAPPA